MKLIVTHAFGEYARGDAIADPALIAAVLASEDAGHVVAVDAAPAVETVIPELPKE